MKKLIDLIDNSLTDKNFSHSYLDTYESLFSSRRKNSINILEIGVENSGSIRLWHDYFQNAKIYCIDIKWPTLNKHKDWLCENSRVFPYIANAYDNNFIKQEFVEQKIEFDIIIDDGPHSKESQIFSAQHYSKLLKSDGVLIIEDVQIGNAKHQIKRTVLPSEIVSALPPDLQKYSKIVDLRHIKNRSDDILVVVDKSK